MQTLAPTAIHMREEMAAQPQVVRALLAHLRAGAQAPVRVNLGDTALQAALARAPALLVSACGSSRHAALLARPAFLRMAQLDLRVAYAHEVPSLGSALTQGVGLALCISQSGETTETCAAQRHLRALKCPTLALVAQPRCTLAQEATWHVCTQAGIERAIPSTKGFIAQASLCLLLALACHDLRRRPWGPQSLEQAEAADALWAAFLALPQTLEDTLAALGPNASLGIAIGRLAARVATCRQVVCLGIGAGFAAACEGALKLNEAAYVPASAYILPEFRHGPMAMLEPEDVLLLLWPGAQVAGGPPRRARELAALGVPMAILCPQEAAHEVAGLGAHVQVCPTPDAPSATWPLVATVVLQAVSVAVADARGVDADAPRYLVKSVVGD